MSTKSLNFTVTGMSCAHCEAAIRSELEELDGVHAVAVSAANGTLTVQADAAVTEQAIIAAVDEAGYAAHSA
ncbi:heavy-metal-associated domain-containing protein [Canibacter zhoujuaniae]|uniref:heavy-metal-associated domain-containing protein n=1 Tax=Canibacter zhoujuaniae TaxID=2708343 RepID=UPI00142248BE|nr:heavy metal-associated domain-containing protein [Canibacter zhoujuaniae]